MKYYIAKKIRATFEEAIDKVTEELKKEGFGIISEIDIQSKLNEKLGVDFRKYKILGACNPSFAHKALQLEDKIGTMLPCNVVIQEISEDETEVAAVNPVVSMQGVQNQNLEEIAKEVTNRLENAINRL
jgi:uncharacterized protein (DUF302 family)